MKCHISFGNRLTATARAGFQTAKRTRMAVPITAAALFMMTAPTAAHAQGVYGSIVGTVTDPTGAVIPNAQVVITDTNKGTTQSLQTNGSGEYTASRLVPDTYSVKVTSGSFSPAETDNIVVTADGAPQVNLTMNASGAATNVTVTSSAPVLKVDQADVSQTLNAQQLESVPSVNRNFTQFTLLTPGVQRSSFSIAPTENPQGTVSTEINGTNYGTLGWLLDGTDNREPVLGIVVVNPTLDSIQDMRVISQNYPAEFGGAVGGFVTGSTKSGGNDFHGDAFEFRRSDALEARDPFTQFQKDPVTRKYIPSSLYNQFGGSISGPIIKDHSFFFLDYQGQRQRVGTSVQQNVPTLQVRNSCLSGTGTCDLSQYVTASATNPAPMVRAANSDLYPVNAIPAAAITPQGIALLQALPAPNAGAAGATTNNYVGSGSGVSNGDQADLRVDEQLNQKAHAFGRYDYSIYRLLGVPVFGAAGGTGFGLGNTTGTDNAQNQSAALGLDYALSSSLLTDVRFGFLAYHVAENKYDAGTAPARAAGILNLNTAAGDTSGSPTYNVEDGSISNFGDQGCNCPLTESEQVFQLANNWTKIYGNHTIKFGGDIRYALNLRNASDNNRAGQLSFGAGASSASQTMPGVGLASVLFGEVDEFQRFDVYSQNAANRQKRGGFYLQDDWRVTPKLTVNYGVRWDIVFPETVNTPGAGGFTNLATGQIQVAGYGPFGTNGGTDVDLRDLGGRLGFAYQAHPSTVIRGAFGQMYDNVGFFGTIFGSALSHNIPVVNDETVNAGNGIGTYSYTFNNLPAKPAAYVIPASGLIPIPNGVSVTLRPKKLVLPEVYQYNLSLEQQLGTNTTLTVAYVGNVADRIYPSETEGFNANEPVLPTSPGQLANRDARRPYYEKFTSLYNGAVVQCCNQDINSTAPAARANYNSLEVTANHRYANGLQFLANYTWSKAMNYGGTYFGQDHRVEYGPNDTNRTNNFVLSGLYDLPFGKNKMFLNSSNRLVNYAVGGWQLNGTSTWESGLPFTPTYAECGSDQDIDTNFASPGTSSDCRPNKTGASGAFSLNAGNYDATTHARRYFTPVAPLTANGGASGAFVRPAFGTIGNIGRNSFRGPSDYFADASLFKNFAITERVHAQFQFQAFNVFNHVPLGLPSASNARTIDSASATAGTITSVDSAVSGVGQPYMRQLQFGARLQF
jgi:hypothetical protein